MKRWLLLLLPVLVLMLPASVGCSGAVTPAPSPQTKAPAAEKPGKAAWEQEWDGIVAKARDEGTLTMITTAWQPKVVAALRQAFKEKYRIDVEHSPAGRGPELVAKIKAEERAGLFLYDFFGMGSTTAITIMKPDGLLGPIEPLLVLPEVREPKNWREGRLPFLDRDKLFLGMVASKTQYIVYNTSLVKEGEITGYEDLLKPEYKGKITINDPTTSGAGVGMMAHFALDLWGTERTKEFLRRLVIDQKIVVERDNRLHIETVARGKYAIALGPSTESVASFIEAGARLAAVNVKEGTQVLAGAGGLTLPTRMAHPNAGRVFLNWLLTKEGQSIFAKAWGTPSVRVDASTEGINPLFLFRPGEKLYWSTEEKALAFGEWMTTSKQVIDEALK
ncbi:MAG: ABC transporter substrate-binding protein [Chloroflexi bacterium]|nr:ABC transporter substrate-binding protein [Chloroflexota bacterium]